jgi:hypothetical protein
MNEEIINSMFPKKEVSPTPLPEKIQTPDIQAMREKLEIAKINAEMKKLESPETNMDMFRTLLTMQQENFKQAIDMQREQMGLQLEIEKLKLGKNDDYLSTFLDMLAPHIPTILQNMKNPIQAELSNTTDTGSSSLPVTSPPVSSPLSSSGGEEKKMDIEKYKQAVIDGKLSEAEAWADFQNAIKKGLIDGKYKIVSRKFFHEEYKKLKNEKR